MCAETESRAAWSRSSDSVSLGMTFLGNFRRPPFEFYFGILIAYLCFMCQI